MVKRDLKPIKVSLTGGNVNQLKKGNATLLKHAQLDESKGTVTLYLRPHVANKLHKAFTKNKGVKLQMIPDEFQKSFSDGGGKITYKKNVAPILKEVVKKAIPVAAAAVTGAVAPELAPLAAVVASKYADKGATALGKATGGWGVGDVEHVRRKPAMHGLNFIDPAHPGWHPAPGLKDNSVDRSPPRRGGSFKPAGGYGIHPAMNPTRDQSDLRGMRL